MKKRWWIVIGIGILAATCGLLQLRTELIYQQSMKRSEEARQNSSYYKACKVINDNNTNIMIYGKEERPFNLLHPTTISSFEEINLDNQFNVLVINDLYEETTLSESNYEFIKEQLSNGDNKLFLIYYGDKKQNDFYKYEIMKPGAIKGYGICGYNVNFMGVHYYESSLEYDNKYPETFENSFSGLIADHYIKEILG